MGERTDRLLKKGWTNFHCHTNADYCCDPAMTPAFYAGLLDSGMRRAVLTDHGFIFYLASVDGVRQEVIWCGEFMENPEWFDRCREIGNRRIQDRIKEVKYLGDPNLFLGIETDVMRDGRLTHDPQFTDMFDLILCGPHFLPWVEKLETPEAREKAWLEYMEMLLDKPEVDVLSHPFRWIATINKGQLSDGAVDCILRWVESRGVALEFNGNKGHAEVPEAVEARVLRTAADRGLPIVISTDGHKPDQIKDLTLVERRLSVAGITADDLNIPEVEDFIARKGRRNTASSRPERRKLKDP